MLHTKANSIPLITNHIDIINPGDIYDIGVGNNDRLYLMYKIVFPTNQEMKNHTILSNYTLFFDKLKKNNDMLFYSKFHGVYFQASHLDYYLIFDYPKYQIDNVSNGNNFNGTKTIYDFFVFLSKFTKEEMAYFLLMDDLIFFTQDKELRIVQFGDIEKINMPTLKKAFENNHKSLSKEKEENLIDVFIRFVFVLYYYENMSGLINLWEYSLTIMRRWNYKDVFPEEISKVVNQVFTMQKNKCANSEIVYMLLVKLQVYNRENKRRLDDDDAKEKDEEMMVDDDDSDQRLNIEMTPLISFGLGQNDLMAMIPGLKSSNDGNEIISKDLLSFKTRTMNFMIREFPITEKMETKNIYLVESLPFYRNKCLDLTVIPQPKLDKKGNIKGRSLRKKLKRDFEDNYFNFKYATEPSLFNYHLHFSQSEISQEMISKYLSLVKEIWGNPFNHTIFPYTEDKSLTFLAICNYDIYKALYEISFLQQSYLKFLINEYNLS